jgi:leucyl/phenylalanyl-tRNA---protein transferase
MRLDRVAALFSEGIEAQPVSFAQRRKRREALLREGGAKRLRRLSAALSFAAASQRMPAFAAALDFMVRDRFVAPLDPPDPRQALAQPDGLCGLALEMSPATLLEGYSLGSRLFAPLGPPAWWSPSRRWAARPGALASAADSCFDWLAKADAKASVDCAFEETLAACACPDASAARLGFGPRLARAYVELFDSNLAHSIEIRRGNGTLAAGAFGVAIGKVFLTEACFGPPDLARAALILLDRQLSLQNFVLHEAQLGAIPGAPPRSDLGDLGLEAIARDDFVKIQRAHLSGCGVGRWRLTPRGDAQPPAKAAPEPQAPLSFASAA